MFEKLSPAVAGLIIMLALLLAAVGMFTNAYLPYREYTNIEKNCTQTINAVVTDPTVSREDIYYYGPQVQFSDGITDIRVRAVNTVQPKTVHAAGEIVSIRIEPGYYTNVLVVEDADVKDDFKRSCIFAAVIAAFGVLAQFIGIVKNFADSRPAEVRTFDKTPDGRSFEEWAQSVGKGEDEKGADE